MHDWQIEGGGNGFRALIVDDVAQRMLQTASSRDAGFQIHEASNGEEAIKRIAHNDYDVVLMDKNMPRMDGDQACLHVCNVLGKKFLPILIVTASVAEKEMLKSLSSGATDFICKPYSVTELTARAIGAARTKCMTDQLDSAEALMFALARMVEAKDCITGDHCSRLQHLAVVFSRKLGLSEDDTQALVRGGVLHDIGKLGIPDSILLKRGPLDDDEMRVMKTHAEIGANLCASLSSMKSTLPIILHHHEAWNGSGYPHGLKGKGIPYLARVFQVLDIYDALSNERPYKKAFSREQVIAIFKEEANRGLRDPMLVAAFIDILRGDPDSLSMPDNFFEDHGVKIFNQIAEFGAGGRRRDAA